MDFIMDLPVSNRYYRKAVILSPCHKTITAEQTSQLLIDNV